MKNIFKLSGILLLGGAALFASCEDDNASNPVLADTATIVLNTPAYSTEIIDLQKSSELRFTWSQPDIAFAENGKSAPIAKYGDGFYSLQISLTGNFTTSLAQQEADESGATVADYADLDEVFNTCNGAFNAEAFDKALEQVAHWDEASVPAETEVFVRVKGNFNGFNVATQKGLVAYSNVEKIKVRPYYIELSDAPVVLWYILGGCVGDGGWSNNAGATGTSNFPFFAIDGYAYDKKTGTGEIEFINYIPTGAEFKILPNNFDWNYAFCEGMTNRNGGDDMANISVSEAGIYRISINTANRTGKIEKYEIQDAPVYEVCLSGSVNDWGDTAMTPVFNTEQNHVWYTTVTSDGTAEVKFKIAGSWDTNWGAGTFPTGAAVGNGANIPVPAGEWHVMFNDITGAYSFIAK